MDNNQATRMDNIGCSSKRLTTFFLVFSIAFPFALTLTLLFPHFEGFSELKTSTELLTTEQDNITTNSLQSRGGVQNMNNNTIPEALQGKITNGTAPNEGRTRSKNIIASEVQGYKNDRISISITDDKYKLFDGLLASGFDEASCRSKVQSHLYRKPKSPHKPSPYLISKLRKYEKLHKRCGPNSRAYDRNMIKIVRSKRNGSGAAAMCKYLLWKPSNGLGNQMISMVATFLYAILTDRVLLIRLDKDKEGLFCEPFINSTGMLPKNSPFWNEQHVQTYQSILLQKEKALNNTLPSTLFLNLDHTKDDPETFFHCDYSQYFLRNVPLLILQSDQYFVPSLFVNPSFNLEITKMFPEKDTVFYHLGRYLYHPSNEAWGLIKRFYETYLAKADDRIGLQIRVFDPDSVPQQAIMDLVLSCTLKNKLLPEIDTQNSVSSSTSKNKTVKAVLVASLYPEYGENLKSMYLNKPTVSGELIGVYQPSHEEHQKFGDNNHSMKAWTEMYLLSLADVLVTTSLSTFGYVAQGLGGLKPWLLYKLTNN